MIFLSKMLFASGVLAMGCAVFATTDQQATLLPASLLLIFAAGLAYALR